MAFFDFFKKKPDQKAVKDYTSAIKLAIAAFAADEGKGWQNLVAAIANTRSKAISRNISWQTILCMFKFSIT